MALIHHTTVTLLVSLAFLNFGLSECNVLKGSVICVDCDDHHHDLSGIKVLVRCSKVKKLVMATTNEEGTFETKLPSDTLTPPSPSWFDNNCVAKIMGGQSLLYARKKQMQSRVVKGHDSADYTISEPLSFYTSCPLIQSKDGKRCGGKSMEFGSSKTIDLPLPRDWVLAPASNYLAFFPIIGIP